LLSNGQNGEERKAKTVTTDTTSELNRLRLSIDRTTLADRVADSVYSLIISGKLKPGARLNEHAMGELFGVSRTPVREAFKTLASEGVIEMLPRRGAIVRVAFSDREVEYLMRARSAIWRLTMEALAEVATDDEIEVLAMMVGEMRSAYSAEDIERFYRIVDTYYLSIERTAGIPVLSDLLNRVQRLGRLIRRFKIGATTDMRLYVELAERLLDAIRARDVERVNALAEEGSRQVLALTEVNGQHSKIANVSTDDAGDEVRGGADPGDDRLDPAR